WVTDAVEPARAGSLVPAARSVLLHDPVAVPAWRQRWPEATVQVLPPAAQPFVHNPERGGPGDRRPAKGVLVVDEAGLGEQEATVFAEVVSAALKPVKSADFDVWATGEEPAEFGGVQRKVRGKADYARSVALTSTHRVLLDAGRSNPAATWTLLEAGAAQTSVVTLPEHRAALASEVAEHVAAQGTEKELRGELMARICQPELRDREALRLHRAILAGHTYDHRVERILSGLGRPGSSTERPARSVSAVAPTNRTHEIGNIVDNMGRQAYPDLELVLVLHGLDTDDADLRAQAADKGVKNLTIVHADPSLTLGSCMNLGIDAASGSYIAKIDDDNFYGAHYLTDLMAAFDYTDAGIVGKWGHYVWLRSTDAVVLRYPDAEHTYERRIQGGTMLIDGELARTKRFSDIPRAVDSDFLDRAIADGVRIYSGDRFNFVSVRGSDRTSHTWQVHDVTFMTKTGRLAFFGNPRVHVEV
ncbi:MAG: glycosyltransferase, partial [Thermocrispum sp.]